MKRWQVGDAFTEARTIGPAEVALFCDLVGDHNPIHFSENAARAAGFSGPIAHGMVAGSLFSQILGNHLPCPGSVYLQQSFNFSAPIYIPSDVRLTVEVVAVRSDQKIITVRTTCYDVDGVVCLDGEAVLLRRDISRQK